MSDSDIIRLIKQTVTDMLAPILMGAVVSNDTQTRSTVQRFNSEAPIPGLRNIQPFGVSSKALPQTSALIIPIAGDPSHLNMVGHFDEAKPTGQDGETLLYDAYGHIIYLSQTKMQFGSKASAENMVLGQVFKTFMDNLLTQLQNETHIGNLGYETSVPVNAPQYEALQESPIDDDAILSDKAFTEK